MSSQHLAASVEGLLYHRICDEQTVANPPIFSPLRCSDGHLIADRPLAPLPRQLQTGRSRPLCGRLSVGKGISALRWLVVAPMCPAFCAALHGRWP